MSSSGEVLDSISKSEGERRFLFAVLAVWVEVERQGVDPDDVTCFGFDPAFLDPRERQEYRRGRGKFRGCHTPWTRDDGTRYCRCPFFNYYRDAGTGDKVRLATPVPAHYREDF